VLGWIYDVTQLDSVYSKKLYNLVRPQYTSVVCSGHSGSTLLSLCLNMQSDIAVFGEFETLPKRIRRMRGETDGLCSFHKESCAVINTAEIKVLARLYGGQESWYRSILRGLMHPYYIFHYRRLRSVKIIVDSSKSVRWASQVWRRYRWIFDQRFIILHRDPRGVVASFIRRGETANEQIRHRAQCWSEEQRQIRALITRLPRLRYHQVFYEKLASNPELEVRRICRFMDVEFSRELLEFEGGEHHIIGGNAGTRARIGKRAGKRINSNRSDIGYYLEQSNPIFLDERWKQDLTLGQKRIIESTCRPEMHRLGYSVEA
jgi:hypothetical protein